MTGFWDVVPCSRVEINDVSEAVNTSKMSGNFYEITRSDFKEDSHFLVCINNGNNR
jgi:hypothetical protein